MFDTWIRDAELVTFEDGIIIFIIEVENSSASGWFESRWTNRVIHLLTSIMNHSVEFRFVVWKESQDFESNPSLDDLLYSGVNNHTGRGTSNMESIAYEITSS